MPPIRMAIADIVLDIADAFLTLDSVRHIRQCSISFARMGPSTRVLGIVLECHRPFDRHIPTLRPGGLGVADHGSILTC